MTRAHIGKRTKCAKCFAKARAANIIQRPDGSIQPIDVQIKDVSPRQSEMWENRANAREKGLAAAQRVATAAAQTDPNPSPAQKEAGNYQKGKVTLHGLRLSIENPRGSIRSGTDATGKPWSVTMPHHYGYFLGTEGKDGDHVDFFLGPNPDSQQVLIINQRKVRSDVDTPGRTSSSASGNPASSIQHPASSQFDEHKVMLGFDTPAQAAKAYLSAYTPGWKGLQSAIPTTIPVLKEWLLHHDTTQPVTRESLAKVALAATQRTAQTPAMADSTQAAHHTEPSPGGLSEAEVSSKARGQIEADWNDLVKDYQSSRQTDKDTVGLWLTGPFWHVTNYTYNADSAYANYRIPTPLPSSVPNGRPARTTASAPTPAPHPANKTALPLWKILLVLLLVLDPKTAPTPSNLRPPF